LPVALSANWLATAWDKNAVLYGPTPGLAAFEQIALDWVLGLLGSRMTAAWPLCATQRLCAPRCQ